MNNDNPNMTASEINAKRCECRGRCSASTNTDALLMSNFRNDVFNHARYLIHRCGIPRAEVIRALNSYVQELIRKEVDEQRRSTRPPDVLNDDAIAAGLLADYKERHKHDGK
jgi:hypothetical protein